MGKASGSNGTLSVTAPPVYRPCPPPQLKNSGHPTAMTTGSVVGHDRTILRATVPGSGTTNRFSPPSGLIAPEPRFPKAPNILQRTAAPSVAGAPAKTAPPVYKPLTGFPCGRAVQPALWGFGAGRHLAGLSGSAGDLYGNRNVAPVAPPALPVDIPVAPPPPRLAIVPVFPQPRPLTTFPDSKTNFTAGEIETLFSEGQLTLGAPRRYDAINFGGPNYSQNYAYDLIYRSRVIGVLHIHYDTNTPADVKTASIGLEKIKKTDRDREVLAYGASKGLRAAARAKH